MNHDNGSTMGGLFTAVALVVALVVALALGYHMRSWGWVINIDGPIDGPVPAHPSPGGKP